MKTLPILLLPEKTSYQFKALDENWRWQGGQVRILDQYQIKDNSLVGQQIAIYGDRKFAGVLAEMYKVRLISPDRSVISKIDTKFLEREVTCTSIGTISRDQFPAFISSVIPGAFPSAVYKNIQHFKEATGHIRRKEEILVSPFIHNIVAKARGFVLNGNLMAASVYEGGEWPSSSAQSFIDYVVSENKAILPSTCVIDVAATRNDGWMVLGFKSSWEADLRYCGARKVIECIAAATVAL